MVKRLQYILKDLLYQQDRKLIERKFLPQLFLSKDHYGEVVSQGYTVIEQVLNPQEIESLKELYENVGHQQGFESMESYFGTFSIQDDSLWKELHITTSKILEPILPKLFNMEETVTPLGGGFCVNPPHSTMGVYPHQDPSSVDERESYTMTMWIALTDMTIENGCLRIIPGSHLWGNSFRATEIPWPLEKFSDSIWEYMETVEMKAGDAVCFDLATIHASGQNTTDNVRLALNVPVLPKNVNYKVSTVGPQSYLNQDIDVYDVDENYFEEESRTQSPKEKYGLSHKVKSSDYHYTARNVRTLIREYRLSSRQ